MELWNKVLLVHTWMFLHNFNKFTFEFAIQALGNDLVWKPGHFIKTQRKGGKVTKSSVPAIEINGIFK